MPLILSRLFILSKPELRISAEITSANNSCCCIAGEIFLGLSPFFLKKELTLRRGVSGVLGLFFSFFVLSILFRNFALFRPRALFSPSSFEILKCNLFARCLFLFLEDSPLFEKSNETSRGETTSEFSLYNVVSFILAWRCFLRFTIPWNITFSFSHSNSLCYINNGLQH